MKSLAVTVFAVLLIQATSGADESQIQKLLGGCVKSSGVNPKVIEDAFQNKIVKEDPKFKEYLGCFFVAGQFANPDGTVDYEAVLKQAPLFNFIAVENRKEVLVGCQEKNLSGPTIAETAFLNFKCYIGLL